MLSGIIPSEAAVYYPHQPTGKTPTIGPRWNQWGQFSSLSSGDAAWNLPWEQVLPIPQAAPKEG